MARSRLPSPRVAAGDSFWSKWVRQLAEQPRVRQYRQPAHQFLPRVLELALHVEPQFELALLGFFPPPSLSGFPVLVVLGLHDGEQVVVRAHSATPPPSSWRARASFAHSARSIATSAAQLARSLCHVSARGSHSFGWEPTGGWPMNVRSLTTSASARGRRSQTASISTR